MSLEGTPQSNILPKYCVEKSYIAPMYLNQGVLNRLIANAFILLVRFLPEDSLRSIHALIAAPSAKERIHMNAKKHVFLAIVIATALDAMNAASASIITYTSRAAWTTDAGAIAFTVDFEGFASDTSFASAPLDVGPFTLSTNGTAPAGTNIVDVSPFLYSGVPASFGNVTTDIYVEGPLTADLTFDIGVHGFFADFLWAGNGQQLDLALSLSGGGSADVLVPGTGTDLVSFGFISTTDSVTSIRFGNSVNDGFSIDNVSGSLPESVPEPDTLALLGLGLAGFSFSRRCKAN